MMSEIFTSEEGIKYILNDREPIFTEFQDAESLSDIFYQDGSTAILVNGHFLEGNEDTFILKEADLGQIFISDVEDTSNQEFGEFVQYINDDCSYNPIEESQIFFIGNEDFSDFQFAGTIADLDETDLNNVIKFEKQEISSTSEVRNRFQYAIIRQGKLHIQSYEGHIPILSVEEKLSVGIQKQMSSKSLQSFEENSLEEKNIDLSSITGRNLLTGQKVTLNNYFGKLKKNLKSFDKQKSIQDSITKRKNLLNNLLNKKLRLGKTMNGKQLIGKIIQIRHNNSDKSEDNIDRVFDNNEPTNFQSIITYKNKKLRLPKLLPNETFEYVSRTLEQLVNKDGIKNRILNKKLVLKIVEKKWMCRRQCYQRSISYLSGHMVYQNSKWTFANNSGIGQTPSNGETCANVQNKLEITSLTIIFTYGKTGTRNVRVILIKPGRFKCRFCRKQFQTSSQLRSHTHSNQGKCGQINLQQHLKNSVMSGFQDTTNEDDNLLEYSPNKLVCYVCTERFSNDILLQDHLNTHVIDEYFCEVCGDGFTCLEDLIPHKKRHTSHKFVCKICSQTFSRQTNLQRHAEIHKGVGNMYLCDVCGCSYHFISSLTRHIVQNHVQ